MTALDERDILSVSQLNLQSKRILQTLGIIWVRGEISSISRPASGHWYFTLKDERAQIRCAMFKGRNQRSQIQPKEGDAVILRGNISLYEPRGDYQLIVEHIEAEGEGRLRQAFEVLKKQLASEGLFDQQYKQALPQFPKHIAIISSATGAAIHDICSVFQRRWPICRLSIFPCLVQGEDAAQQIVHAIELANQYSQQSEQTIDALIVGRGGGSLEDLQAFNNEQVARTIFDSTLPIVSAVGHEIDFTISDFVADIRAPTPSAAAEILAPHQDDVMQQLDAYDLSLQQFIKRYINDQQQLLHHLRRAIKHPRDKITAQQTAFKHLFSQLNYRVSSVLSQSQQEFYYLADRLIQAQPNIEDRQTQLDAAFESLQDALPALIETKQHALQKNLSVLNAVSPLATLERGYAIVNDSNNSIVHDAKRYRKGDQLRITLSKGSLVAEVLDSEPQKK